MRFTVALVLALAACGGGQCPPGQICAGQGDDDEDRCAAANTEFMTAIIDRGTCFSDTDCLLIGGQFDAPTCDCAPFVGECAGVAIANNAPGLGEAEALISEIASTCSRDCAITRCTCDCAPAVGVMCDQTTRRCFALFTEECFGNPPDAGIDAPQAPDAAL